VRRFLSGSRKDGRIKDGLIGSGEREDTRDEVDMRLELLPSRTFLSRVVARINLSDPFRSESGKRPALQEVDFATSLRQIWNWHNSLGIDCLRGTFPP